MFERWALGGTLILISVFPGIASTTATDNTPEPHIFKAPASVTIGDSAGNAPSSHQNEIGGKAQYPSSGTRQNSTETSADTSENEKQLEKINKAMQSLDADTREIVLNRWLADQSKQQDSEPGLKLSEEDVSWLARHSVIEIGVDGNWPPIDYMDDSGKHRGITEDYLALLGERLGVEFRPLTRPAFKEMLESVTGGI